MGELASQSDHLEAQIDQFLHSIRPRFLIGSDNGRDTREREAYDSRSLSPEYERPALTQVAITRTTSPKQPPADETLAVRSCVHRPHVHDGVR